MLQKTASRLVHSLQIEGDKELCMSERWTSIECRSQPWANFFFLPVYVGHRLGII
jgi:hypothetical protein